MAGKMLALVFALLASPAAAMVGGKQGSLPELHRRTLATIPITMFAEDCKLKSAANQALIAESAKAGKVANPGVGLEPFEPFQRVLKDGFYLVDCVKDKLHEFGDKHGDGKFAYNMGAIANVSIVHYTDVVPREDQKPMSHETCFQFCRSAPGMNFFGIHNGRDCYCAPYYQAMESDSTQCDAVCEGTPTQMCGGAVKSSIFGMHSCTNTATLMQESSQQASTAEGVLSGEVAAVKAVATTMQSAAERLQGVLATTGDPAASNLMQAAKVFAGELTHTAEDKEKIATEITKVVGEATNLGNADLSSFENAEKAEEISDSLAELAVDAEDAAEELTRLLRLAQPVSEDAVNASGQYYPLMYFVDKAFVEVPTTCSGDELKKPMANVTEDECAHMCDANFQQCVGYSFFEAGPEDQTLCFMFAKFKTAVYYAGCTPTEPVAFLQKRGAAKKQGMSASCKAKFSKFEGTSVAPNPSGECENCLREATQANRCPFA